MNQYIQYILYENYVLKTQCNILNTQYNKNIQLINELKNQINNLTNEIDNLTNHIIQLQPTKMYNNKHKKTNKHNNAEPLYYITEYNPIIINEINSEYSSLTTDN